MLCYLANPRHSRYLGRIALVRAPFFRTFQPRSYQRDISTKVSDSSMSQYGYSSVDWINTVACSKRHKCSSYTNVFCLHNNQLLMFPLYEGCGRNEEFKAKKKSHVSNFGF